MFLRSSLLLVAMSTTDGYFGLNTTCQNVEVEHTTAVVPHNANGFSTSASFAELNRMRAATQILLILIGFAGIVANGFVLFALIAFKDIRKSTTNVFIGNQTIIDAIACIALTATMMLQKTDASKHAVGFNKRVICWFFDSTSFLGASVYASKFSLVIITLERYFMVVHPVQHRNNLRPWMVKLGVIVPWIDGLCTVILPIWLTSDVVGSVCEITMATPGPGKVFSTLMFIWHFLLPLLIFTFCYSKILSTVRRQNQIRFEASQLRDIEPGPSGGQRALDTETVVPTAEEFSERKAKTDAKSHAERGDQHISQTEKKVIRTMLTVTACFIVCWFPVDFFQTIYYYIPQLTASLSGILVMTVLAYMNVLLNAVIYSSHLGVISRCWRAFRKLYNVGDAVGSTATTHSSSDQLVLNVASVVRMSSSNNVTQRY
jgi:7 transmembrane receptor (rhodopsin family)